MEALVKGLSVHHLSSVYQSLRYWFIDSYGEKRERGKVRDGQSQESKASSINFEFRNSTDTAIIKPQHLSHAPIITTSTPKVLFNRHV